MASFRLSRNTVEWIPKIKTIIIWVRRKCKQAQLTVHLCNFSCTLHLEASGPLGGE
jgi:hypothetical protein